MPLDPIAALLLGEGVPGAPAEIFRGATLTSWDPTTAQNVVSDGAQVWRNRPVLNAATLALGPVLLGMTRAGPVILGNLTTVTV